MFTFYCFKNFHELLPLQYHFQHRVTFIAFRGGYSGLPEEILLHPYESSPLQDPHSNITYKISVLSRFFACLTANFPCANFSDLWLFHMWNWLCSHIEFSSLILGENKAAFRRESHSSQQISQYPLILRTKVISTWAYKIPYFYPEFQIPYVFPERDFLLLPFSLFSLCSGDPALSNTKVKYMTPTRAWTHLLAVWMTLLRLLWPLLQEDITSDPTPPHPSTPSPTLNQPCSGP